jgi:hypothetical protein
VLQIDSLSLQSGAKEVAQVIVSDRSTEVNRVLQSGQSGGGIGGTAADGGLDGGRSYGISRARKPFHRMGDEIDDHRSKAEDSGAQLDSLLIPTGSLIDSFTEFLMI